MLKNISLLEDTLGVPLPKIITARALDRQLSAKSSLSRRRPSLCIIVSVQHGLTERVRADMA
jgi:hypothetical protein